MLFPISCTCGRSLDDIHEAFEARRRKLLEEKLKSEKIEVDPEILNELSGDVVFPNVTPIFNDYHIKKICCKRIFLGNVGFYELLAKTHLSGPPTD